MTFQKTLDRAAAIRAKEGIPQDGATIYTGRNWSRKWSRIQWEVQDGIAYPKRCHHFWCSVAGKVEDITDAEPCPIIITRDRFGRIESAEVAGYGRFQTSLF